MTDPENTVTTEMFLGKMDTAENWTMDLEHTRIKIYVTEEDKTYYAPDFLTMNASQYQDFISAINQRLDRKASK